MSTEDSPNPRVDEIRAELWNIIRRVQSGELSPAEANAITKEISAEIRAVESAIRAANQGARVSRS